MDNSYDANYSIRLLQISVDEADSKIGRLNERIKRRELKIQGIKDITQLENLKEERASIEERKKCFLKSIQDIGSRCGQTAVKTADVPAHDIANKFPFAIKRLQTNLTQKELVTRLIESLELSGYKDIQTLIIRDGICLLSADAPLGYFI